MDRFVDMILSEKKEYLNRIKKQVDAHHEIVIYGAGVCGKNLAKLLLDVGVTPRAFCVSNPDRNRKQEWGIPIRSLSDVIQEKRDDVYLIAAEPPKNESMIHTLNDYEISAYIDITPHFLQIVDPVYLRPIIEITSRVGCKVNCRYCPQNLFIKKYRSSMRPLVTSFETFQTCLDHLPQDVVLDFAGFAEPFLNPQIVDMMEYAVERGHNLRLYTTLIGASGKDLERVLKIPFLSVVLHLPDKKKCANIPITGEYLWMLESCLSAVKEDGQPFIDHANAQCEPPQEILDRIKGRVRVSWDMIDWAGNIDTQEVRSSELKNGSLLCAMAARQNHNILLPDGSLLLCCMDWGMEYILGNLMKENYKDIVQGKAINEVRMAMLERKTRSHNFLCKSCTSAVEIF
ncbi:MAG: SPASM domain-containing protein [Selenomonadaceae bacterium]|nr:SPASM domain-containing protein [Selenomonadaceae bacterium]